MLGKRLVMIGLSAMLALTTVAFTAPAVSADSGHSNVIVQVDKLIDKAETAPAYKAARKMTRIRRVGAHWADDHGFGNLADVRARDKGTGRYPAFILIFGCRSEFDDWWVAARQVSKTGFRYYRGQTTGYSWLEPDDAENRAFFQSILFNRAMNKYDEAAEDVFDCVLDESKSQARRLRRLLW